jgi:hypothetical protein
LGQAAVITLRAASAGAAFSPEKNGRTFGPRPSATYEGNGTLEMGTWHGLGRSLAAIVEG